MLLMLVELNNKYLKNIFYIIESFIILNIAKVVDYFYSSRQFLEYSILEMSYYKI